MRILLDTSFLLPSLGVKLKVEEEKKEKKAWTTLTPIVRRKPEEGILAACKGGSHGAPAHLDGECVGEKHECVTCDSLASS